MPVSDSFFDLTDIDRRKCSRTVPMQIVSPSLPRTGTDSLKQALEILGYGPVYHGFEANFQNALDQDMWMEALEAKYLLEGKPYTREDWDRLLGHCRAVTDVPSMCFGRELIEAYPEAKVILMDRDPDAWLASINATLFKICKAPVRQFICQFEWHLRYASRGTDMALNFFFGDKNWSRAAKRRYLEHKAMIQGIVPADRLLLFNVADGWEPLCNFLDKRIPDGHDFPNGNAGPEFFERLDKLMQQRDRVAYRNIAITISAGVLALGWALTAIRRR